MAITNPVAQWINHHWEMSDKSINRDHVLRMLYDADYHGQAVEVGTFAAGFAERILQRTSIKKLICIDPYVSYDAYKDLMNSVDLEHVFFDAQQRLAPYHSRYEFMRQPSIEAAALYSDSSLDFVYIDGNHSYSYVLDDLNAWWPKVRLGGMIVGDDAYDNLDNPARNAEGDVAIIWDNTRPNDASMYGVTKAFVEFANNHQLDVVFYNSQAIIVKL